jgi:hypothetical protein
MASRAKWTALALAISLLSTLLAFWTLPPAALAQDNPDDIDCPLSDEQTQNSIQAFDKIAKVFTGEPRCVNCHGAVNPFGADANAKHGGGKLQPVMKTEPSADTGQPETTQDDQATFQQCSQCHSAFPGHWQIPPATLSFVGKDAFTLCRFEKDFFNNDAEAFLEHIEHDVDPNNPFIQEAFTGRKGLNDRGQSLANKYPDPPKGVTRQDLIQMAHDWVNALGGKFPGDYECGCKRLGTLWSGTMKISVASYKGPRRCTDSWTADMKIRVSDKGVATGSGTARRASAVICAHPTPCPTPQVFTFSIAGESDQQSIRLKYSTTGASPSGSCDYTAFGTVLPGFPKQRINTIPKVAASHAEAHYQVTEFFGTSSGSIDAALDCVNCVSQIK